MTYVYYYVIGLSTKNKIRGFTFLQKSKIQMVEKEKNVFSSCFISVVPNFSYMDFFRECSMFLRSTPLKQVRVSLYKTDVLHRCNKLLVCLNSKFDELKEFDQVSIEKKRRNFLQCLELFLKGEIDLKERKTQFMQNWCLVLL